MDGDFCMTGQTYQTPGVYFHQLALAGEAELGSGVPLFIGYAGDGAAREVTEVSQWERFAGIFGTPVAGCFLAYAVRGYFANGGTLCYVCSLDRTAAVAGELERALARLAHEPLLEKVDLLCAPDLLLFPGQETELQQKLLDFCRSGIRENNFNIFAILDSLPHGTGERVLRQRQALQGDDGALYYPWIQVADGPAASGGCVPPSGHIAGIYARSDRQTGVHKAPANELIEEALDLAPNRTGQDQALLNPGQVNCLRVFPGRGIRVWGARTLSRDPAWLYVNVRRQFLSISRWIGRKMAVMTFEPNDAPLRMRLKRELASYLGELYRKGAFRGSSRDEAFYVKCDAELNSRQQSDNGELVVEIGLATAAPGEFIIIRIVQAEGRVSVTPQPTVLPAAPVAGSATAAAVVIAAITENPPGADLAGENLLLRNQGARPVEMTNWVLRDRVGHRLVFPRLIIQPGMEIRIWTGSGDDSLTDLYWGHRAPLWNNTGDAAYLYDAEEHLIASFEYVGRR